MSQFKAIAISLVLTCALPGCCQLQNVANSFSHWGETRIDCENPETCTPGCPTNCVTLQPPEGYLSEGPTFVGDTITGPAAKTSLDRMVELDEELGSLRKENEELMQRVEISEQTIQDQGRAIDTAGQELQRALRDYSQVRSQLEKWDSELDSVNGQVRNTFQQHQRALNQFEDELESILAEFDPTRNAASQRTGRGQARSQPNETRQPLNQFTPMPPMPPMPALTDLPEARETDLPQAGLADPQIESLPIREPRLRGVTSATPPNAAATRIKLTEEQPSDFQKRESQVLEQIQFGPPIFGLPDSALPPTSSSAEDSSGAVKQTEPNDVSLVPPRNHNR